MKKFRVAIIGIAHVHTISMMHDFGRYPDKFEVIGCAGYPPYTQEELELYKKLNVNPKFGCPFYEDYKELLSKDIDIAAVCTSVKDHARAACEILGMNIHTIVEKPMCMCMEDAEKMYSAAKKSKAELIINWPIAWFPAFNKVKELADAGKVGQVLRVQYRSPATTGPYTGLDEETMKKLWWYKGECGGGSVCDYAGYGCTLSTWITGKTAESVSGVRTNTFLKFSDVEDYSLFVLDFGSCIGLAEGSWSTLSDGQIPTGPVVYGTKGVIVADRRDRHVKVYTSTVRYSSTPEPDEVYLCGEEGDNLAVNVYEHFTNGTPLHEILTIDFNMRSAAALDAGRRSCFSGKKEQTKKW